MWRRVRVTGFRRGDFRIRIESELILVGARSSDTLSSLTRGIEGTSQVMHLTGENVELVLTAAGLARWSGENVFVLRTDEPDESELADSTAVLWYDVPALRLRVKGKDAVGAVFVGAVVLS